MTENITRNNPWMRKKGPGLSKKSTACLIPVQQDPYRGSFTKAQTSDNNLGTGPCSVEGSY
ncbi:MAG: hypothetical protein DWI24_04055 [Planctomycetota bacterium]|nr:MAG: hypothetical protein DWI24_04055 [Planctomycetota bacterium]